MGVGRRVRIREVSEWLARRDQHGVEEQFLLRRLMIQVQWRSQNARSPHTHVSQTLNQRLTLTNQVASLGKGLLYLGEGAKLDVDFQLNMRARWNGGQQNNTRKPDQGLEA